MVWLKRLVLMIQFLTRIPIPLNLDVKEEDFAWGTVFFPLVGLLVGLLMAIGYCIGVLLSYKLIPAVLAVLFQALITGVFHIDGLGDTFDGLFSNKSKDKMLEIMKDSRLGTNAAVAILFDVLLKILLLDQISRMLEPSLSYFLIFSIPIVGKVGILTSAAFSKYARPEGGLGRIIIDNVRVPQWLIGLILAGGLLSLLLGKKGLLHMAAALLVSFLFTGFVKKKIGGATGDTLGAVNEICEICFLLFFKGIQNLMG